MAMRTKRRASDTRRPLPQRGRTEIPLVPSDASACALCDVVLKGTDAPQSPPQAWGQLWVHRATLRKAQKPHVVIITYDRCSSREQDSHSAVKGIHNQILIKISTKLTEACALRMIFARSQEMHSRFATNFRAGINIPFEVTFHGAAAHFSMPFCGTTLAALNTSTPVDADNSWGIVFQIAFTLDVISALGFERSDLHDENILLYRLSQPVTLQFNEIVYGYGSNPSVSYTSWILRTNWLVTLIDWESAVDQWERSSTRSQQLVMRNQHNGPRSVIQEDIRIGTHCIVPNDATVWHDLENRALRNRGALKPLADTAARFNKFFDSNAFAFLRVLCNKSKPLQEMSHFSGNSPTAHAQSFFYRNERASRLPIKYKKGEPVAEMRLYDTSVLHAHFHEDAPLRGTTRL